MELLERLLELRREINKVNEMLEELRYSIISPKNQNITGMPRGSENSDTAIERYLLKAERLRAKKERLQNAQRDLWRAVYADLNAIGAKMGTIELMQQRFYHGHAWKVCAKNMNDKHPKDNWNTNKCFRAYGWVCKNYTNKNR